MDTINQNKNTVISFIEALFTKGDLVVEQFTASGTQRGEIFGAPASGRTVSLPGINIWRVRDGRIVERWGRLDDLGLLRQLGLLDNEFGREDVNKFVALAESADPVGSLDRATGDHRPASARYQEIMGPLG